jgi:osmotically inducible protein OsmC
LSRYLVAMSNAQPLANKLYSARATAVAGREGSAKTDDGNLDVKLAIPKSMGGGGGAGTNPEQLFAAGYAACFGSAMGHIARLQKLVTGPISVTAEVDIGPAGKGFGLQVALVATVPELSREQAEALVKAAHEVCPYSNATRGNIVVDVSVA